MSLYKGNNLISGHQVLYSTTGQNTDGAMTQKAVSDELDNKVDLDYSNADYQPVNKAGDTMTGNLLIDGNGINYQVNGDFPTSTPSSDTYVVGYEVHGNGSRIGLLGSGYMTNGDTITYIQHERVVNDTTIYTAIRAGIDTSGNAFCTFPNTTCCDGQYVNTNTTIATNVSVNGSSNLTYTLNLPSDGRLYMVWIMVEANTGSATGNYVNAKIGSDVMTSTTLARATTRTTSGVSAGSTACIVVSSSHKIYLSRAKNWNGTVNLLMMGYRRIGTNA